MKEQVFIIIGKLTTALVLILAFLLICSFVSNQAIKASDRYDQGQRDMIAKHKLENKLNAQKETNE